MLDLDGVTCAEIYDICISSDYWAVGLLGCWEYWAIHMSTGNINIISFFLFAFSYWGKIGGSGSIVATVLDMSKWLKMLLNDGTSEDGNEVIPSDVIKDSHATYMTFEPIAADAAYIRPESPVSYTHFSYGLAWRIGFYRGKTLWKYHWRDHWVN